ncbi:MAG: TonB family protein [Geobacter sp.]|nr:TonB family protein [Geobacter sp.]
MPVRQLEKKFCYLLLFSLLVHAALFLLLANLPPEKTAPKQEPFMVDLEGIPLLPPSSDSSRPANRYAEQQQRVAREVAPKGDAFRDKISPLPAPTSQPVAPRQEPSLGSAQQGDLPQRERSPKDALFKRRGTAAAPDIAALYPGAARLERLEESYRKRYGAEVAEGDASFLNVDDIRFGSFLRRFETAVYGVWRYPAEAAKLGIEGITPVKITFNRRGEIIATELLQSSGSKLLDEEVMRTLKQIGPVGALPRGYDKEAFKLIAFFHYGIIQGAVRLR